MNDIIRFCEKNSVNFVRCANGIVVLFKNDHFLEIQMKVSWDEMHDI